MNKSLIAVAVAVALVIVAAIWLARSMSRTEALEPGTDETGHKLEPAADGPPWDADDTPEPGASGRATRGDLREFTAESKRRESNAALRERIESIKVRIDEFDHGDEKKQAVDDYLATIDRLPAEERAEAMRWLDRLGATGLSNPPMPDFDSLGAEIANTEDETSREKLIHRYLEAAMTLPTDQQIEKMLELDRRMGVDPGEREDDLKKLYQRAGVDPSPQLEAIERHDQ